MPLSYLRRPLCLLLVSYILLLALLHAWGAFRVAPSSDWDRYLRRRSLRMEVELGSGFAPKRQGERVRVRILRVWNRAAPATEDAFLYLPTKQDAGALRPGQRIEIVGRLRRPRWPRVPGDFDEKSFCSDKGIAFIIDGKNWTFVDATTPWYRWPHRFAEAAHRSIHAMLNRRLPQAQAALWEGLLLGYVGPLPMSMRQDIQDAGVMHLLVPSGAKMTFILAACIWMASRLGLGLWMQAACCALVGGLYALVVGAEPPYLRAYACALVALAARPLERDLLGFQAVLISAFSLIALAPRELFSAGFQMSYAAMAGILIALPSWRIPTHWPAWLHAPLRLGLMSLVVQLALWPLLARIFGRVSLAGLVANAVLVPFDGVLMAIGFLAWPLEACGLAFAPRVLEPLGRLFAWLCGVFAALPGAAWDARPLGWRAEIAFYLAVIGIFSAPKRGTALKAWLAAAVFAAWSCVGASNPNCGILFLEKSGRGAIVARLPAGRNLVVASTFREAELGRALFGAGVRKWTIASRPVAPLHVGRERVEFGGGLTRVSGGPREFCILHPHFSLPKVPARPGRCERSSTRRDGAIWIRMDDDGSTLETQRELDSIGRSLL